LRPPRTHDPFSRERTLAITASDPVAVDSARLLLEDERTFIDLPRSPLWWGTEHVVIGVPTA